MKKVKNVLKGYLSCDEFDSLTIINYESETMHYSGPVGGYLNPEEDMKSYKKRVDNLGVEKSFTNGMKIFIFVKAS